MKKLRQFLNKLKIGYKCRSTFIKIHLDSDNLKILHYFYKKGWIKHYFLKKEYIIVYLRYVNKQPLFYYVKFVSTPGYRQYMSKKGLTYYKRNNARSALVLINTSSGLLTLNEARILRMGGEISCVLYE